MNYKIELEFDPYQILDIERTASINDIKTRFRTLTLKYHPDRNRRVRNYDPSHYNNICKAYAILMDPSSRSFNNSSSLNDWGSLKDTSKKFRLEQQLYNQQALQQAHQQQPISSIVKDRFTSNDLNTFNTLFERQKTADPNDHGYGDEMVESNIKTPHYNPNVPGIVIEKQGSERDFNRLFEEKNTKNNRSGIMEFEQPSELISGSSGWTDIALFEGNMIIGKETSDYSKQKTHSNDLEYTDYKQSFSSTITGSIPSSVFDQYRNSESNSIDRLFQQRLGEQATNPYDSLSPAEKKSFNENKEFLIQQKQKEIEAERQKHRDIVLKYKHQYNDNYLDSKSSKLSSPHHHSSSHSSHSSSPHHSSPHHSISSPTTTYLQTSQLTYQPTYQPNNQLTRDTENDDIINQRMSQRTFLL